MKTLFRILRGDLSSSLTEGFTERLQGTYSITLIFALAGVLLWNTGYSTSQISCTCPQHFTTSNVDYAYKVCWSQHVHYLPFNSSSAKDDPNNIPIFNVGQYSGFIAIGLAMLLLIPKIFARFSMRTLGTSVNNILELASESTEGNTHPDCHAEIAKAVSEFLEAAPNSYYLTVMYAVVKLLYLIILFVQLVLIEWVLGIRFTEYIKGMMYTATPSDDMLASTRFPSEVLCSYDVRRLGNVHRYTLQCTIPGNQLYEKLWILFLFWVVTVTIVGTFSLTKFAVVSFARKYQVRFISDRVATIGEIQNASDPQVWFFVQSTLGRDGFLLLKLMSDNVSESMAVGVIGRLWKTWCEGKEDTHNEPLTLNPMM